jgi:hypothetical protein
LDFRTKRSESGRRRRPPRPNGSWPEKRLNMQRPLTYSKAITMKTFSSKKTNYLEEHFRFVMIKHDLSIKAVIMAMDFFI